MYAGSSVFLTGFYCRPFQINLRNSGALFIYSWNLYDFYVAMGVKPLIVCSSVFLTGFYCRPFQINLRNSEALFIYSWNLYDCYVAMGVKPLIV